MDLESTIIDLNNTVWKHTKHIEEQKKAFGEKAAALVGNVASLAAACDKTDLFISEIEARLEASAQTPTQAEILLHQMLSKAQGNLEETQAALAAAETRLKTLQGDHDAVAKLQRQQRHEIQEYTRENKRNVAEWERLLGLAVHPQRNGIMVEANGERFVLEREGESYRATRNGEPMDFQFHGSLAGFLLTVHRLSLM